MSYVIAEQHNILPAVAVVQMLLTRAGNTATVDGNFGARTKDAVKQFQRDHKPLVVDGSVSVSTWPRLVAGDSGLTVLDCIDIDDGFVGEVVHAQRFGGNPLVIGGMCNGVEQAVTLIANAAPAGSVCLLRFHGHGSAGGAGAGAGTWGFGDQGNIITSKSQALFRRLRPLFSRYGCIQFMHCSTGRGPNGTAMLQAIANGTGVPATAALNIQLGGGSTTFRYEGPTKTAVPGGGTVKSWASNLPALPGRSFA
ncbi:peptidoglycan-binding domain-containing protein [Thermomonas sp.]|uniref:peptidoglycan-binding domain-containing protein n=1 Tax=Thermomonas sp. TaxID=1971895 RepID=UPI00248803FD|nr:peptidoglycan-binding domain-containing protein [Thermomonas sp.]MDI1252800.1 peptidoglycan-binding domain-containing protein [Thermomonas sp.]